MPFRQIHRLTFAKLMSDTQPHFCKVNDFYWISNNYPSFFSLITPKNSENRLLLAPVPPCPQPCLPPPCPRSRKFSSGLQLRAPSLVLPP